MPQSGLTGTRIREKRIMLGLKQSELAQKVGISPSYLNLIEHNRRRIAGKLIVDIARHLSVDPKDLTEGAEAVFLETLREIAAGYPDIAVELDRLEEMVSRFPGWAALLTAQFSRQLKQERTISVLSDRLTHDPFLSTSLHEVISTVTAIRATSSILTENKDIDAGWLARFHRNINEESQRLTESSQSLVAYLDGVGDAGTGGLSPQEELDAFLGQHNYHFAMLEEGRSDTVDELASRTQGSVSHAGRAMIYDYLIRYCEEARALPASLLAEACRAHRVNPFEIATSLAQPLPLVLRRLATLQGETGTQRVGIATCDGSGAILFRREVQGFPMPRIGAGCSLWPLYQAMMRPMMPIHQVVEQPGPIPERFDAYAIAEVSHPSGFSGPQLVEATMLIVSQREKSSEDSHTHPVGASCRICPRKTCVARREASILVEEF